MNTMGNRVKLIRKSMGLNQEEFSKIFNCSNAFISAVEKDKSKLSVENLIKLLVEYNVNINYLLADIGEMFIGQDKADLTGINEEQLRKYFKKFIKEEGII